MPGLWCAVSGTSQDLVFKPSQGRHTIASPASTTAAASNDGIEARPPAALMVVVDESDESDESDE